MGWGTRFLVLINTAGSQDRLQLPPHRPVSTSDFWHCCQRSGNNNPCHLRHWEVTRHVRLLVAIIIGYSTALLSGSDAHSVRCDHRALPFDTCLAEVGTAEIPPVGAGHGKYHHREYAGIWFRIFIFFIFSFNIQSTVKVKHESSNYK